jgi:hypothetical protein
MNSGTVLITASQPCDPLVAAGSLHQRMERGVPLPGVEPSDAERLAHLPGVEDQPDGIYYPHATHKTDDELDEATLAALLADCVGNGRHHLATLDHPEEGMVIGCSHCHLYWRTHSDRDRR